MLRKTVERAEGSSRKAFSRAFASIRHERDARGREAETKNNNKQSKRYRRLTRETRERRTVGRGRGMKWETGVKTGSPLCKWNVGYGRYKSERGISWSRRIAPRNVTPTNKRGVLARDANNYLFASRKTTATVPSFLLTSTFLAKMPCKEPEQWYEN